MKCDILSTFTVVTKDDRFQHYIIENGINFEEINNYLKKIYKDNLDKVVAEQNIGYLHK